MAEVTAAQRCTTEVASGYFCNRPSLPHAPFPICPKHASAAYAFVRDALSGPMPPLPLCDGALPAVSPGRTSMASGLVYYIELGGDVKIGWTRNLRRRLHAYPPSAVLLAVEPGTRELEKVRHQQFAHLLVGGREWFRGASSDLREHVATVLSAHGLDIAAHIVQRSA